MTAFNALERHPGWIWEHAPASLLVLRHKETRARMSATIKPGESREDVIERMFANTCGCPVPHFECGIYIFHAPGCTCYKCGGRLTEIVPSGATTTAIGEAYNRLLEALNR